MKQDPPSTKPTTRAVNWRLLVPLALLLLLLAGLYLWPQTATGRGWILSKVEQAAQSAGYDLDYQGSRGNPWTGLTLEEVSLRGPGLALSLDELELDYFLPSLVTGELPLSIGGEQLRGSLDLADITAPRGASGGAGLPIRPRLQELSISDVALQINNAPYTLPTLDLQGLTISDTADGLRLRGTLATGKGSAELDARVRLNPFSVQADINRADLSLGQHWWPGVQGGTARGTVTIQGGAPSARLELTDGVAEVAGITITDIAGELRYNHPQIEAELTGQALGGPVAANGSVDIANRQWQAEVAGRAGLQHAVSWLAEGQVAVDPSSLPLSGQADVNLSLSGWESIRLEGQAAGAGELLGHSLDDLDVAFTFETGQGTTVNADALYDGEPLTAALRPAGGGRGFSLDISGDDLPLTGALRGDLRVQSAGQGQTTTQATLDVTGSLAGRELEILFDTTLDSDGLQVFVTGQGELGATLEGAAVLQEGDVQGQLQLEALRLPWLTATTDLTLTAEGSLQHLPLTLEVDGKEPLYLEVADGRLQNDLRGELSALWTDGGLENIQGELGALALNGHLSPRTQTGTLSYTLAETPVRGRVSGVISLHEGRLELTEGSLSSQARLRSGPLELPGATLPALDAQLELSVANTLQASLVDAQAGLQANYRAGRLELSLDDTPLVVGGVETQLQGDLALQPEAPLATLALDLQAHSSLGELQLSGDAGGAALELSAQPGLSIGALSLQEPLNLSGQLSLKEQALTLKGELGELELALDAELGASVIQAGLTLATPQDRLELSAKGPLASPTLSAQGNLPLAALADPLGLELQGQLRADLSAENGSYSGRLDLKGRFREQPFQLHLLGAGQALNLEAQATVAGLPVGASGTLLPELGAEIQLAGLGQLTLSGGSTTLTLEGQGTVPAFEQAGLSIPAQPWTLSGTLNAGGVKLQLGASQFTARRTAAGWRLEGNVVQPINYRNLQAKLVAGVETTTAGPAGKVSGRLELHTPGLSAELPVSGSLQTLTTAGTVPADLLTAVFGVGAVDLRGNLAVEAALDLLGGLNYQVTTEWQDGAPLLQASVTGTADGFNAEAHGEGLQISYLSGNDRDDQERGLELRASDFNVAKLVSKPEGAIVLSGALSHQASTGWDGALSLSTPRLPNTRLALTGSGETLNLSGMLRREPVTATLDGSLLPQLDIDIHAQAANARLEGVLSGSPSAPQFSGTLALAEITTPEDVGLHIPAQQFSLSASLADGLQLTVQRPSEPNSVLNTQYSALLFEEGSWSGGLELPFTLHEQAHLLQLAPSSQSGLTVLSVDGMVSGPLVQGPVSLSANGLEARLQVAANPWLPEVLSNTRLQLALSADPDLSWQAALTGQAALTRQAQMLPLELQAQLAGEALSYQGNGQLRYAGEAVGLSVQGQGRDLHAQASLDETALEPLATLSPLPLGGTISGALSFDTGPAPRLAGNLSAEGTLAGQPLDLQMQLSEAGLELAGTVLETEIQLSAPVESTALRYTLSRAAQGFELSGQVRLAEELSLEGDGRLGARPLTLTAFYTPGTRAGSWQATLGEAQLQGELHPADGAAITLTAQLQAPAGSLLDRALQANLQGRFTRSSFEIDALQASAGDTRLTLAGRAWPEPDLSGELTLAPWLAEPLALKLAGTGSGYALALENEDFTLRGAFTKSLRPLMLASEGRLSLAAPLPLTLTSDLSWRQEAGFQGRAALDVTLPSRLSADLMLSGQDAPAGALAVGGTVGYQGETLATLALNLGRAPWQGGTLDGSLSLHAPLSELSPTWPGEPLLLTGELEVSGNTQAPALAGPLRLSGALDAAGTLEASPEGISAVLEGEGLSASAALDAGGWQFQASAQSLNLAKLLPQVSEPTLSTQLELAQPWDGPLRASAAPFALRASRSQVQGELHWSEGPQGSFDLDLNFADLNLGGEAYRGVLSGTLALDGAGQETAARLSGTLDARSLGLEGSPWGLSGSATLGGDLRAPRLELDLYGEGRAEGRLQATLLPQSRTYALISDLHVGAFHSNAALTITPGELNASGQLAWQDYLLELEPGREPRTLVLRGQERLAGWRAVLGLQDRRLRVEGSLGTLSPQAAGELELDWRWAENGRDRLQGRLEGLTFGQVELGDVQISSAGGGEQVVLLEGEAVTGRLRRGGGLSWQLDRLELPLGERLHLRASGEGTLATLRLNAQLRAELPSQAVTLPLELSYAEDVWRLQSESSLLSGAWRADLAHHSGKGWSGTLLLEGAQWQGIQLGAEGSVSGPLLDPRLSAELHAAYGPAALLGSLEASRQVTLLEGKVQAPTLREPLLVSGQLWPGPRLQLATAGGRQLSLARAENGTLTAEGGLELHFGPLMLQAEAAKETSDTETISAEAAATGTAGDWLRLELHLPLPGLAFGTTLPDSNLPAWLDRQLSGGLALDGLERTEGRLVVHSGEQPGEGPALELQDLRWQGEPGVLALDGRLERQEAWQGNLVGSWQGNPESTSGLLPWLSKLAYLPFTASLRGESLRLQANGEALTLEAGLDLESFQGTAEAQLAVEDGRARLALEYTPGSGPQGSVAIESLPLVLGSIQGAESVVLNPLVLNGDLRIDPAGLSGRASLSSGGSELQLSGTAGWAKLLPAELARRFFPQAADELEAEVRVAAFDPLLLPWAARRLPYLDASLNGVVQVRGDGIVGQIIAPELNVQGATLPTRIEFNGPLEQVELRATLGESRLDLSYAAGRLSGLINLEQFPLQMLAEAVVGESGVTASVTGVVRLDIPLRTPGQGFIQVASQRVRLERNGVLTEGNVAFTFDAGTLVVERAEFNGAGRWNARGRLTRERLDFKLSAEEANFTPLLSLLPPLAELGVGAQGSLNLSVQGTPQDPIANLDSAGLELQLAGGRYRLEPLSVTLRGNLLKLSGELMGVSPIGGRLELSGGGRLQLSPLRAQDLQLNFKGQASVPPIGTVSGINGVIRADDERGWRLESRALLGEEVTLSGSLAPLDLHLSGTGLNLQAPDYFLSTSVTDADLHLRYDEAFVLSGALDIRQALLSVEGEQNATDAADTTDTANAADTEDATDTSSATAIERGTRPDRNPLLERIHFDNVRVHAPQQVRFQANFGSGELAADLSLSGSAAEPALDGEVRALRGSFAFSGRDFNIEQAIADFDTTRGVYPLIEIQASSSYEKQAVLEGRAADIVEFVAPRESSSFQVFLTLTGDFQAENGGPRQLDLVPELSSNALIQVAGQGGAAQGGPRPLDDQELISLLALGRLDLEGDLLAQSNLAGSVAQSALDTAIDLFILSELQNQLGEALGLDLLEIRTSSLSSLFSGGNDFSVSLQLGGYIDESLFATYSIGRLEGEQDYAFGNEFNLRYDLDRVSLTVQGGLNFLNESLTAVPEFGLALDYAATPLVNFGANLNLSSQRQSFGIGLNIRW